MLKILSCLLPFALYVSCVFGQPGRTISTFSGSFVSGGKLYPYRIAGGSPEKGGTTTIPTSLVPISFRFSSGVVLSSAGDIPAILQSPIFEAYAFAGRKTQYTDAVQRAEFGTVAESVNWHTLLGKPRISAPIQIDIPAADGYVLHSERSGASLGVVDLQFARKQLFERLGAVKATRDELLIAVTKDTAFYALNDATVCCAMGSHGVEPATGQSFVLASYLDRNAIPRYTDIQALTEQLAEWMNDPLSGYQPNRFPAWKNPDPAGGCEGTGESSQYFSEQPSDAGSANASEVEGNGREYHVENMALLSWFSGGASRRPYSFPDVKALTAPAQGCNSRREPDNRPGVSPMARSAEPSRHALIGYWEGYSPARASPLRDVSQQWDIVIATFAAPVKGSTSLLRFRPPATIGDEAFRADVKFLQSKGRKVLISLGGGGEVVTLNTARDVDQFVSSVSEIVSKYGFDGVDLDIETPSLLINEGDTDFRRPTTPSVVNLISAMQRLHDRFGPKFMISEVPEAAQTQAGMVAYGGQFGSFLPVIYGTRNILSFVDAQDYNTPPLQALDGNYYFPGHADYHLAMSEMLVHGFTVAGGLRFPPLPPEQVAVGLPATPHSARNYTSVPDIESALGALIAGKPYPNEEYTLRRSSGYPGFLGAMFWAINEDRRNNYEMSNSIGPFLHAADQR